MIDSNHYCGPSGCDPLSLITACLHDGSAAPKWPQFTEKSTVLTHSGRAAIALALRAFGIGEGDEVLVPAYNCGSEIDAVASSGATLVPFRVDRRARIDLADITRRTTPRTRMVYVTHYFGWPQDLSELDLWRRERGLVLLEDCALSLFSFGADGLLGCVGDSAVFSFRKTLGVPDGGALVLNSDSVKAPQLRQPPRFSTINRRCLALAKASLLHGAEHRGLYGMLRNLPGLNTRKWANRRDDASRPDIPADYYFDPRIERHSISRTTAGLLHHTDPRAVVNHRRSNYRALSGAIGDLPGVRPLVDSLPEGVCPLSLPLRVRNRDHWTSALTSRGIAATAWWAGYHRRFPWDDFADACELKDEVITLPVHHDLSREQIGHIANCVREIAAEDEVRCRLPQYANTPSDGRKARPPAKRDSKQPALSS